MRIQLISTRNKPIRMPTTGKKGRDFPISSGLTRSFPASGKIVKNLKAVSKPFTLFFFPGDTGFSKSRHFVENL